jgi:hypothetical protein
MVMIAGLALMAACDVQVRERFRTESTDFSETTFVVEDDDRDPSVTATSVASGTRPVSVPADIAEVVTDRVSVLGRPVDMRATLAWMQEFSTDLFDLRYGSIVSLDLTLLRVNELERLGVLGDGEALDPDTRWYSVTGTVRHNLTGSECVAEDAEFSCELASVTDGAIDGLASRRDDVVTLSLFWKQLGRAGAVAVPAIGVRHFDDSDLSVVEEHQAMFASLEAARFVGGPNTEVAVGGEASRVVRSRNGTGVLEAVDVG